MSHFCHWPGCDREVPPRMWGCKPHWYMLPGYLRTKIWTEYVDGQEITKTPTRAYVQVAREVQEWIIKNHANKQKNFFHSG